MLKDLGFTVALADSGLSALDKMCKLKDLRIVIASLDLPDINGIEFLSWERKIFAEKPHVFILISKLVHTEETKKAKELGVDLFINRPIDQDFLQKTVRKALNQLES